MVKETDALLVGAAIPCICAAGCGSRTADLVPSLREAVYVGLSAGAW